MLDGSHKLLVVLLVIDHLPRMLGGSHKLLVVLLVIDHLPRMQAHVYFNIDLSTIIAHHVFTSTECWHI